ncbi:Hypothetical protein NTJ_09746 [Nesidiocoris tenuis]|uniref:Uncharacterized protein n=1 Tax=Nesidiocoris tenuis TaxID=355587 RepID=A0ABN7AZV1_9HEMI|nr:Hypothetical protein NTJ_09746 [Nesidiocoris tenuis]
MKCLIALTALFGVSLAQYWGLPHPVRDLPEVVAAREEHLAAVEAVRKGGHYVPKPLPIHYAPQHHYEEPQKKWTGPIALPPGYDKHGAPLPIVDLPEVAAEKAKHLHLYGYGPHAGAVAAAAAGRYAESHSAPIWTHNGPQQLHYSHPQTHPLY